MVTDYIYAGLWLLMALNLLFVISRAKAQQKFWKHMLNSRQETLWYMEAKEQGNEAVASLHFHAAWEEIKKAEKYL